MPPKHKIIEALFSHFTEIRYVAIYTENELVFRQKEKTQDSSSSKTDQYEELLVNPTLLTAARQRGNIDCGGLRYLIVGYGNFYQLLKEINRGHISICLPKETDINEMPEKIFEQLNLWYPGLCSV